MATATQAPTTQQVIAQSIAAQQSVAMIQQRAGNTAVALWLSYPVHDDEALADFMPKWLPVLQGSQRAVGLIASTSIQNTARTLSGDNFPLATVPVEDFTGAAIRQGVSPSEVYQRPFVQFWSDLSQNKPIQPALKSAQARLQSPAETDVRLAYTHAAQATLTRIPAGVHVVGYRRVLGSGNPCPLCVVASTQRYHRENLMPIHNHCHCSVEPIVGTKDLGQKINAIRRSTLPPDEQSSTLPVDTQGLPQKDGKPYYHGQFSAQDIVIQEHGEIGPYLAYSGQPFLKSSSALARAA